MANLLETSVIALFLFIGACFIAVAAIGVIRLPDVYGRIHAASKSSTLGVMMMLIGVFLHFVWKEHHFNSRILLGIVFLFITGPVGAHVLSRSAYYSGVKVSELTRQDDLAAAVERKRNLYGALETDADKDR